MVGRNLLGSVVAAAAMLLSAQAAAADVTSSSITSPSDPYYFNQNWDVATGTSANQVTVTGTTNGSPGDSVDLDCISGPGPSVYAFPYALNVPVQAGGSFHYGPGDSDYPSASDQAGDPGSPSSDPLSDLDFNLVPSACKLIAVPAGLLVTDGQVTTILLTSAPTPGSGCTAASP